MTTLKGITREAAQRRFDSDERDEKIARQKFDNNYKRRLLAALRAGQRLVMVKL